MFNNINTIILKFLIFKILNFMNLICKYLNYPLFIIFINNLYIN